MKLMVSLFIKLLFLSFIIYPQFVHSSNQIIKNLVQNIVKSVPQLEKEIDSSPKTEVVRKIINTGFQSFYQSADITQYSGVRDENVIPFLLHLKKITTIPEKYQTYFVDNLSMILYSDFDEIIIFNVMYDIDRGGECKYICIIANRDSETGTIDFLVGDIKSQFTLSSQIMVVNETKWGFLGIFKETSSRVIEVSPNINNDQIATLFKYFTVCIFKRFGDMLDVKLRFLSQEGFLQ